MNFKFLSSNTAQSTIRVCVFLITMGVLLNLIVIPILIYLAIKSQASLSWLTGYVYGLAALAGTGLAGKAVQKKFETQDFSAEEDSRDIGKYGGKIDIENLHM